VQGDFHGISLSEEVPHSTLSDVLIEALPPQLHTPLRVIVTMAMLFVVGAVALVALLPRNVDLCEEAVENVCRLSPDDCATARKALNSRRLDARTCLVVAKPLRTALAADPSSQSRIVRTSLAALTESEAVVAGRVVDLNGLPRSGVQVEAGEDESRVLATTDADGFFTAAVGSPRRTRLVFDADHRLFALLDVIAPALDVRVVLNEGVTVSGQLVMPDGQLARGGRVELLSTSRPKGGGLAYEADVAGDGTWRAEHVRVDSYVVSAQAGAATATAELVLTELKDRTLALRVPAVVR
jgi:hypothetical protein